MLYLINNYSYPHWIGSDFEKALAIYEEDIELFSKTDTHRRIAFNRLGNEAKIGTIVWENTPEITIHKINPEDRNWFDWTEAEMIRLAELKAKILTKGVGK